MYKTAALPALAGSILLLILALPVCQAQTMIEMESMPEMESMLEIESMPEIKSMPEMEWCLDDLPNHHNYPDAGAPYGPTVDFMLEVARRAGVQLQFSPNTPFARCLRLMEQGKTDIMIRLNSNPERQRFMYLIPYDHARPEVVLIRQDSPDITSVAALKQVNLMVIRGYVYNDETINMIANHQRTSQIDSLDAGLQMLLFGRTDAIITTAEYARQRIQSNPDHHGKFKMASLQFQPATPRYIHLGISKKSRAVGMKQAIIEAIASITKDNLIDGYFHQSAENSKK